MKKQVNLSDAIGKTVVAVEESMIAASGDQRVIVFSDGTFACLGVDRGYEAGDESIVDAPLSILDFGDAELVRSGVASAEEIESARREQLALSRAAQDAHDRREFDRLQRKFADEVRKSSA